MVHRVIVAILLLVPAGCGSTDDAGTTVDTTSEEPGVPTAPAVSPATTVGVVPEGFTTVGARVVPPGDEPPCEVCLWSADSGDLRGRGLMGVTDLGGLDGMAFVYDEPRTTSFTMRNTVMPLSIVFYGPDGTFLEAFDMVPCEAEPCPSYPTPEDFTVAIEVPSGQLDAFGMVPGSRLDLTGACP